MSEKKGKHHSGGGTPGEQDEKFKGEYAVSAVFHRSQCCRLGLTNGKSAYVVPMTFTYEGYDIYLHSVPKKMGTGKKDEYIEYMQKNNIDVCLEFDVVGPISPGTDTQPGCFWSLTFASVIGFGKIVKVDKPDEIKKALNMQLQRYTGREWDESFGKEGMGLPTVWKILLDKERTTPRYHLITPPVLS